ncbi:MAG: YlbF family regulator [Thermoleophilia bacterium]
MSVIMDKAQELADAISESEQLGLLREAAEKVDNDEAATTALQKFQEKQEMVQRAASSGLQLPPEQMEELQAMQAEIRDIPSIQGFASAQTSFNELMDKVNEIISCAVTGKQPGDGSDGESCDAGCSCGH